MLSIVYYTDMNTKASTITAVVIGLLVIGLMAAYLISRSEVDTGVNGPNATTTDNGDDQDPDTDNTDDSDDVVFETDMVKVFSPAPNSAISSPLRVRGEARGNWYFEASFPVRILDASGRQLAVGVAQAQGEWMTTDFVPFDITIPFVNPGSGTGTLVLEKDNPSGLPEHAAEVRIPIRFSSSASNEQVIKLFFYDEARDRDASGNVLCSSKGLVSVNRTIPSTQTPLTVAVRELLEGPTAAERSQHGLDTEFPLSGVTLTSASIANGVATLTFSDPQNRTGGGSCRIGVLLAQIEATAKQFASVNSIRIQPSTAFQP